MKRKKIISIIPISDVAKDRFENIMNKFHSCRIEKETTNMFFLSSLNKQYFFWCPKVGNEHWIITR